MPEAGEITLLLQQAELGDLQAAERLFCLVRNQLVAIAVSRKRGAAALDISTMALVDDAFCSLVGQDATQWHPGDRRKFFNYASVKMHDLLVEAARAQSAQRRGGGYKRVELDPDLVAGDADFDDYTLMLDLREALSKFEEFAKEDATVFRVRYFFGSTFDEVAGLMGISTTQAKRCYERAKLWLQSQLRDYQNDS